MRLVINGVAFRTSGSAQPIDSFEKEYADLNAILGQEEALPFQDCSFCLSSRMDGFAVSFRFGDVRKDGELRPNEPCLIRGERNVLGVEITFTMEA